MSVSSVKLSVAGLLLLGVALFFVSGDAEAIDPEWSYETGGDVSSISISADGEYIVTGSKDDKVYLFDKDSSTPLWSYTASNDVGTVSISADGGYIAADAYNKFYLFDKDSSTPLWSYDAAADITSVAISADGEYIIVGVMNREVLLFHKDSSTPFWTYNTDNFAVDISGNGELIAVGSDSDPVHLFDKDSNTPIWSYNTGDGVHSIAISSDGEYIVVGAYEDNSDTVLYLFNKNSSVPIWTLDHDCIVSSVDISSDGEYIAVGICSKVYLFDKDSNTPIWTRTTGGTVRDVSISADASYITVASGSDLLFFHTDSNVPIWSYDFSSSSDADPSSVSISSDGKHVSVSYGEHVAFFKNNLTSRPSLLTYGPRSGSESTTSPQLGWFAGSDDRSNLTFDVYFDTDSDPTTKIADDITAFYYNAQCLDIDTKYYWKVIATDGDGSVNSSVMNFTTTSYGNIFCVSIDDDYDPAELTIIKGSTVIWTNDDSSLHTVTEDDGDFDSGSISPGNTWSYTFDTTGTFDYYDQYDDDYDGQIIVLTSYPPVASIDSISPQIAELDSSVSFSGSGSDGDGTISEYKWISSIDGDLSTSASFSTTSLSFGNHTITFRVKDNDGVWSDDATSWVDVRKSPEWSYDLSSQPRLSISADGEYIAVGSYYKVYLFSKDSSTPLWSYTTNGNVESVAISANGEYIAAGSYDNKVYLFDKDSSTPLWSYTTGNDNVMSVAISADGEYIVAGSYDYKVYFFDTDSSTPLWSYETGGVVQSVAISADGKYIVAGTAGDDKVYLFDKDSSTPLWSYATSNTVYSVTISADGEYIVAGSADNKVYLFDKDSSTPLWSYGVGNDVNSVAISADGKYIVASNYVGKKIFLFDKDSSTPLWSYSTGAPPGSTVYSVAISADGGYITAGSSNNDDDGNGKIILFGKNANTPLWIYSITGEGSRSVSISSDGKYIGVGAYQVGVSLFKNDPISRPSVISYGPRSNSTTLNDTTLRWFPGSDDIANLTFDVYLSFIYNDVANNNSAALIADDITNYTYSVTGLTESKKYYWKVVATDPSGSATSRIMNFTVGDYTAPVTDITSGPSNPSDYTNATFYFEADEDNVDFKCKMDTGSWSYCSSPETYTDLSRGTYHQFKVKATDPSGNEGDPDTWIWEIIDNDIPELTDYNVSPSPAEPGQLVYFYSNFSDSDGYIADYSWTSSIDGLLSSSGNFSTDDLSTGSHSIKLRAKDNDGDWSANTTFNLDIGEEEENNPPELTNYNVSPNPANYGDRVYFYTNFSDSDGYIADYSWISDSDGLLSSSGNFSTDDLSAGSHSIRLRARDDDGAWSDNTTFDLNIEDGEEESDDPVAYWKFDEGSGDISYDSSGNGFNGILQNNPAWVDGISGGALEFVGDANVEISNFSIPRSEGTITVWFQIHNWSTDKHARHFFSDNATDRSDSTVRHAFSLQSNGSLRIFEYEGISFSSSPLTWEDDQWYHLSFIWEASGRSIMRDGQIVATTTQNGSFSKDGIDLMIGNSIYDLYHNPGTGIGAAEGVLDEVSIWNRALSSTEIQELYDNYEIEEDIALLWNYTVEEGGNNIGANSISADGEYIITGSTNKHVYLFRKDSETPLWNYSTDGNIVTVSISADGSKMVAGSMDGYAYVFSKLNSTPLWSYNTGTTVTSVDISKNGEYVVVGSSNRLSFFDISSSIPIWTYATDYGVSQVSISANGNFITTGGYDGEVLLFNKESGTPLWIYDAEEVVSRVILSEDANYIVASSYKYIGTDCDFQSTLYVFERSSNTTLWEYQFDCYVHTVSVSADGQYIVAGDRDKHILYLFGKDSSTPIWTFEGEESASLVLSVDISLDGDYINLGYLNTIYLFNRLSNVPIWEFDTDGTAYFPSLSGTGRYFGTGTSENTYYLFRNNLASSNYSFNWDDSYEVEIELPEDGFTLEFAGEYDTDGDARDVVVVGDLAYVADYDEGFLILDVSDVSDINEVDRYKQSGFIYSQDLEIVGNTAFVAGVSQISVYDITNPYDIIELGEYDTPDATPWYGITVRGNLAYVAAGGDGLFVLDISDVSNIMLLDAYNTDGISYDVEVVGDLAYVADFEGIVVLDISNPSSIQFVGSYSTEGQCAYVVVDGDLAYVAAGEEGLVILDISNPEMIDFVGSYDTDGAVRYISLVGKYAIIADNEKGALALDISEPSNPEFVTSYDTDGDAWGIAVTSDYVYVADYSNGIVVLSIVPTIPNSPPTVSDISISPNPAYSNERVYFSANYSDSDGNVAAFEWRSDIDGVLNTSSSFDSDNLSVGHHNISFLIQDDDEAWSDTVTEVLVVNKLPVYGCTNLSAINHNPEATVEDGSCVFEELEDTSNVTSNYYFSPLEEFALTTSYEDLSTTQNYSISVQAQYEQYQFGRTNRAPVSVGAWSIGPFDSDTTISIEFAEMWWAGTDPDYEADCEWTFYIYHNGGLANEKVVSCGSNGDDIVREVYNISTSLEVKVGDMVDLNIWYEGWEGVEIFYGSQSVPTGFYISGLEIEDECSFDSFMDNIYVQSPSISGPVIDEYMLLEVGKGSYHFVSEDNVYISWETTDLSGIKLDNGQPLPSKKSFTETTFDYENRIFTGKIDFALEGGTYGGAASWDYQMIFSEDYTSIIGGQIYRIDSGDKIFYTWTFGDDGNYPYYALCTLTAADYYSENPFEDTTSPDEQVTTPEDGGLTLPFSGNPLAYGAIIFILGLLGAGFAAMSARQSIPGLISELQGLVDAGISDPELNSALEDLENMDGLGFFSNDRANAMRLLDNYNEMTDQALGSMRQLDELQGVVDELQAAGVSSPELEAEIAEIESMLNSQVEGDTNKDFSANLFESFRKNKEGS